MSRPVSKDFIAAMEEKLEWGRNHGRTGWDSHWKKVTIDSFSIWSLMGKLHEEVPELYGEIQASEGLSYGDRGPDLLALRKEAADVANVAMMIADMAGALNDEGG